MFGIIVSASILLFASELSDPDANMMGGANQSSIEYRLHDGDVYRYRPSYEKMDLPGYVVASYPDGDDLYFITIQEGFLSAAVLSPRGNYLFRTGIPSVNNGRVKLAVNYGVFYFSVTDPERGGVLYRYSPEKDQIQSIDNVNDFSIISGNLLIMKDGFINYNGHEIPLMLKNAYIRDIIDERIIVIGDGVETEICDTSAARSIYQYKGDIVYDQGDDFNILLEFADLGMVRGGGHEEEKIVYYNITVNGYDIGRTETGPGTLTKQIQAKVSPGRENIINAERWELDKNRGRYVRVNNINQPEELRVFIPLNRVVKLSFRYDGSGHGISQNVFIRSEGDFHPPR